MPLSTSTYCDALPSRYGNLMTQPFERTLTAQVELSLPGPGLELL